MSEIEKNNQENEEQEKSVNETPKEGAWDKLKRIGGKILVHTGAFLLGALTVGVAIIGLGAVAENKSTGVENTEEPSEDSYDKETAETTSEE